MFLGGLGLTGWGTQDLHEVGKFEGHIDVWRNNTIAKNAQLCDEIYNEAGV
jgi:hypothetical protein